MPLGMQASIFSACPKPALSGMVVAGRASSVNMVDDGGGPLISPDGVAPSRMVGVSVSVNLPLHHKVQKEVLFWHWLTRVVPEKGP